VLEQLVHPLTLTLALLGLAALALLFRRRRAGFALVVLAFAWSWLLATPAVSDWLRGSLEQRFTPAAAQDMPRAEAIVVLGGGVSPTAPPRVEPNLNYAADRLWYGAQLYRAGKAPLVIVTGGNPYAVANGSAAQAQAGLLTQWGVPPGAIVARDSLTTYTDALVVQQVMQQRGLERILLVTSALHMPRAFATFDAAGIDAYTAPTDFEVVDVPSVGQYAWLPDNNAFWGSGRALHEYVGMLYYRLRGWM